MQVPHATRAPKFLGIVRRAIVSQNMAFSHRLALCSARKE